MNMTTVPSNQLKAMQQEIEWLKEQVAHLQILERQLAEKDAELKTERIRLAACGVVALANTPDSAAKAREKPSPFNHRLRSSPRALNC